MAHGPQGTGNYKGKRDRHEKTPHNSAQKEKSWTHIGNKKKKQFCYMCLVTYIQ